MNDGELLGRYVEDGAEPAFEELVRRHADLVYSSALRRVGPGLVDDVTQAVFIVLARKAPRLVRKKVTNLAGWLYRATRYAALDALRRETRRQDRETAAAEEKWVEMRTSQTPEEWEHVKPMLDDALDRLSAGDRDAVLLRFFEGASFAEVGVAMGIPENTAAKRVARALQKLHKFFNRKGIALSMPILSSMLSANTTEGASAELSASCTSAALAGAGALAGGATVSALLIAEGAMRAMAISQFTAATVATCVLLTAGVGTAVTVNHLATGSEEAAIGRCGVGMRLAGVGPVTLEYKSVNTLPDGAQEFQINTPGGRRTYFVRLGEQVEGYTVVGHKAGTEQRDVPGIGKPAVVDVSELTLERGSERLVLTRNRPAAGGGYVVHIVTEADGAHHYLGTGDTFDLDGTEYQVAEVPPKLNRVVLRRMTDDRMVVLSAAE